MSDVRGAATKEAAKHTRTIRSARDGRLLSALMLPFFQLRPPSGYGVIATTGRKTRKTRRKCVRVIRRGDRAYLVQLRPPQLALERPNAAAGWVWNIRANPQVRLRMRGATGSTPASHSSSSCRRSRSVGVEDLDAQRRRPHACHVEDVRPLHRRAAQALHALKAGEVAAANLAALQAGPRGGPPR